MACGLPDGTISLVRVRQGMDSSNAQQQLSSDLIDDELEKAPANPDDATITALEWISLRSGAVCMLQPYMIR